MFFILAIKYSDLKRKEILKYNTTWVNKDIIVSAVRDSEWNNTAWLLDSTCSQIIGDKKKNGGCQGLW
jgi:hypothetical protein